jgi:serine/threonine protein kinase
MDPKPNDSVKFRIKERLNDFGHSRLLYLAETSDGKTILVKFVRQYCHELHDICASSGHAPALLGYERLPGSWYVEMEYVANAVPITLHGQIPVRFQRWEKDLRRLISEFHDRGLVHGDLRDANIISGDDGYVKLVDFDWGGKDGEVSYPTPNLNPDLTKGRSSEGLRITKADKAYLFIPRATIYFSAARLFFLAVGLSSTSRSLLATRPFLLLPYLWPSFTGALN